MIEQIVFVVVLIVAIYLISRRIRCIRQNINIGKPGAPVEHFTSRIRNVLLIAFGQKKMFKRPVPALLHLCVYLGFLIINLEVLEFVLDGLTGTHRMFAPHLGEFYAVAMNVFEVLALAVLLACVVFLVRRNITKLPRFWSAEMTQWPRMDANIILVSEIVLMLAILTMNAADQKLQLLDAEHYPSTGSLIISSGLIPLLGGIEKEGLVLIERFCWWFHILGILAFAVYITYSKHLHIALAFPYTYFSSIEPAGKIQNMPAITNEVKIMLGLASEGGAPSEQGRFGARDINDLPRTSLLAAYACTECGRCTSECPANLTGKKLSPRKIMMDVRDRMEEVGRIRDSGGDGLRDGSLLDTYITREEINACTSCNACVEACPVLLNPLSIILELKRYVVMEESAAPQSWNSMFQNIETNFAPWKFAPTERFKWSEKTD